MSGNFFGEFKKFIARGNVIDLAVGVIIGAAFTAITNSVVNDIIMPVIGLITGGMDFAEMRIILKPATEATAEVAIRYGLLINAIINFLLVALVYYLHGLFFGKAVLELLVSQCTLFEYDRHLPVLDEVNQRVAARREVVELVLVFDLSLAYLYQMADDGLLPECLGLFKLDRCHDAHHAQVTHCSYGNYK